MVMGNKKYPETETNPNCTDPSNDQLTSLYNCSIIEIDAFTSYTTTLVQVFKSFFLNGDFGDKMVRKIVIELNIRNYNRNSLFLTLKTSSGYLNDTNIYCIYEYDNHSIYFN